MWSARTPQSVNTWGSSLRRTEKEIFQGRRWFTCLGTQDWAGWARGARTMDGLLFTWCWVGLGLLVFGFRGRRRTNHALRTALLPSIRPFHPIPGNPGPSACMATHGIHCSGRIYHPHSQDFTAADLQSHKSCKHLSSVIIRSSARTNTVYVEYVSTSPGSIMSGETRASYITLCFPLIYFSVPLLFHHHQQHMIVAMYQRFGSPAPSFCCLLCRDETERPCGPTDRPAYCSTKGHGEYLMHSSQPLAP